MPSVIVLMPPARQSAAANCGCISVGKPGYGMVFIFTLRSLPELLTVTESSPAMTVTPISRSLAEMDSRWRGMTLFILTSPPAAAAATIYVPASIWSGIIVYVPPWRLSAPFILTESVPAPRTSAPIEFKKFAKSTICGSLAAFSMTVLPRAMDAARIIFIVAPTETLSRYIRVPCSLPSIALA